MAGVLQVTAVLLFYMQQLLLFYLLTSEVKLVVHSSSLSNKEKVAATERMISRPNAAHGHLRNEGFFLRG